MSKFMPLSYWEVQLSGRNSLKITTLFTVNKTHKAHCKLNENSMLAITWKNEFWAGLRQGSLPDLKIDKLEICFVAVTFREAWDHNAIDDGIRCEWSIWRVLLGEQQFIISSPGFRILVPALPD